MNRIDFFGEYFVDVKGILEEYLLTHGIKYIMMWRNMLPRVHG